MGKRILSFIGECFVVGVLGVLYLAAKVLFWIALIAVWFFTIKFAVLAKTKLLRAVVIVAGLIVSIGWIYFGMNVLDIYFVETDIHEINRKLDDLL